MHANVLILFVQSVPLCLVCVSDWVWRFEATKWANLRMLLVFLVQFAVEEADLRLVLWRAIGILRAQQKELRTEAKICKDRIVVGQDPFIVVKIDDEIRGL